ncbi:NB-ARC domain-containing protein [Leptolyngbya sp. FACHB-261]|uniref:NB-ARC domain-containing protein n=1 Tax=Leptolyngbya sp. FACHB-261 TaxID=2692806 RepID=UPI00168A048E|nr:NB-ARC domain-containing protein [Leptolyngbya sp. FACHB-261]MBD2100154.1 TIR domain-containing protein [Leptolyngbya sp. FACHB-261]
MSIEIFLSHVPEDEELLKQLEKHLKSFQRSNRIRAWAKSQIEAGQERRAEIEAQLNRAHLILLMVSSDYIASDDCWEVEVVRALERRQAEEAQVIPVILRPADWEDTPLGELQALPRDSATVRAVTLWSNQDEAWVSVTHGLRSVIEKLGKEGRLNQGTVIAIAQPATTSVRGVVLGRLSATVPELPQTFLSRSVELDALKFQLLSGNSRSVGVTGTTRRVGVQGMGGIGKSVLAAALARDEAVRQAFPDGVLWLSVGQEVTSTGLQLQLARMLGERPQGFASEQEGKAYLSELLQDKTCLLVLDDVWQTAHLKALNVVGEKSRLLTTTRDSRLLKAIEAAEYRLGLLSDEQALELLALWADQKVEALPSQAREVAQECGNLPLALAMAGAMVQGKPDRWDNVLSKLRNADLAKIQREFPDYPYPNLLRAIEVSVDALEAEDRARYLDFAVFPEDTLIPETVLQTLWAPEGLGKYDTQDAIDRLVERSLLQRNEQGQLSLHDLQRDYVRKQGGDLLALHNRFLDAYRAKCEDSWSSGPNDGYFFERLAHHLRAAGRNEELYRLLTKSPAWMEAKFAACTGDSAYVADLKLAIDDFADRLKPNQLLTLSQLYTARQVVYQRVSHYTDTDLGTLVRLEQTAEAISHARLRPDAKSRFDSLMTVYQVLCQKGAHNPSLLAEAEQVTQAIKDSNSQAEALRELATALRELATALTQAGQFSQAKEVVLAIEDSDSRAEALVELATALTQTGQQQQAAEVFSQAKEVVLAIEGSDRRAKALVELAIALAQAGQFSQAKEVALAIESSDRRAWALVELAIALAQAEQFSQAKEVALAIESSDRRAKALVELAIALAQAGQFSQAKEVALAIEDSYSRAKALRELATALTQAGQQQQAAEVFSQAKEVVLVIKDSYSRAKALVELATALTQTGQFSQAKEVALAIEDSDSRAKALVELAIALAQTGQFSQAKEVVLAIEDSDSRAKALVELATALTQAGQFSHAQQIALAIEDSDSRAKALVELATALTQTGQQQQAAGVFSQAKEVVLAIESSNRRAWTLVELATALTQAGQFSQAKEVALVIKDSYSRAKALVELATALTQAGQFSQAKEVALAIEDSNRRAWALVELATALTQTGQQQQAAGVFSQAKEVVLAIEGSDRRAKALRELATALTQAGQQQQAAEVFSQAKEVVLAIEGSDSRAEALRELVIALTQIGCQGEAVSVFREAQQVARETENDGWWTEALKQLASALAFAGKFSRSKQVIREIDSERRQAEALGQLAAAMSRAGQQTQAHQVIKQIKNDAWRAEAQRNLNVTPDKVGNLMEALATSEFRNLDKFMADISTCNCNLEQIGPGLSVKVLREAVRIASWVSPSWQKIHELLHESGD